MSEKKRDFWDEAFAVAMLLTLLFIVALFALSVAMPGKTLVVSGHAFGGGGSFSGPRYLIEVEGEHWWQHRNFVVPESTWRSYEVGDVWEGKKIDG